MSERRDKGITAPNNGAKPHKRRGGQAKRQRQQRAKWMDELRGKKTEPRGSEPQQEIRGDQQ